MRCSSLQDPTRPRGAAAGPRSASATRRGGRVTTARSRAYGSVSCGIAIAPTKCSWKRGSIAVSIFSTRRTTSSISARAARLSSAIRAPVPAALPARGDAGRVAVGDEPEHQRVDRVDVAAERAGEADPVDVVDPVVLHQQRAARVERGLRELDLAHVVLGDRRARARRRGGRTRTCGRRGRSGACGRERAVDHAVGREDAGEEQLGDHLDDARAADAGHVRAGEAGLVGPQRRCRSPGSAARASPGRCARARSRRARRAGRRRSARPRTRGRSGSTRRAAARGCRARSRRWCRRRPAG